MDILVVGGGAAGMMAAISAADCGHKVTILEKNNKLGKKLFLTGKGRCNLTNACDMEELFANIVTNKKFLYSSLYDFDNLTTIDFFERLGLKTKIERGNRVFPLSDHSSDVIRYLERELKRIGVEIKYDTEVIDIITTDFVPENDNESELYNDNGSNPSKKYSKKKNKTGYNKVIKGLKLSDGKCIYGDSVIMATGGASYPSTGSDGTSFNMISEQGISIVEPRPALVPLNTVEDYSHEMSGLSLKNVELRVICEKKEVYRGFGEMLFTHFGVSGPLVLSASSYLNRTCYNKKAEIYLDLKPALSEKNLDDRILRDFSEIQNKQFKNSLNALLPSGLIPSIIMLSGIDPYKPVNSITKEERSKIVAVIKKYPLTISSSRKMDEAIITTGGVSVKEINPSTMESKIVKGLYFAGEMIDVDALTGGFNLQIAWSTGHMAGKLGGI